MWTFDGYQEATRRTARATPAGKPEAALATHGYFEEVDEVIALRRQLKLAVTALGLAGEAGEVCDRLKKEIGHGHPEDNEALVKELGDCLWYVAHLADKRRIPFNEVPDQNIKKLAARYPEGFTVEKSLNRSE